MIDGRVRFSEIDHTRKITVPSIINYFQDCSTFQSEDIGVGLDVLSKKLAERNFCMTDENGEKAAYAQSVWVYMDVEKGRPVRPDQEELDAYGQCEPLEMDYESRKIALPEECMSLEPFPVRRYHIDTNEHVNNCQYVQMAMEMLDQERVIRQVRVEYKKSAVLGDMIVPRTGDRDGRTVVELCTTEGELYAAVEFAWV